jgi:hypothetical protein
VQLAGLKVPSPIGASANVTVPVGVVKKGCDAYPSVSVTVAVHFVEPPTMTWDGTQLTAVEVLRRRACPSKGISCE